MNGVLLGRRVQYGAAALRHDVRLSGLLVGHERLVEQRISARGRGGRILQGLARQVGVLRLLLGQPLLDRLALGLLRNRGAQAVAPHGVRRLIPPVQHVPRRLRHQGVLGLQLVAVVHRAAGHRGPPVG